MAKLSTYADQLPTAANLCYLEKVKMIGGIDQFAIGRDAAEPYALLLVDASDIVSYLVLHVSLVMVLQFKARESMEAYNQFSSGWVKEVRSYKIEKKCVLSAWVSVCRLEPPVKYSIPYGR